MTNSLFLCTRRMMTKVANTRVRRNTRGRTTALIEINPATGMLHLKGEVVTMDDDLLNRMTGFEETMSQGIDESGLRVTSGTTEFEGKTNHEIEGSGLRAPM